MAGPEPDNVLATLTLDELADVMRFIEVSEHAGRMTHRTAEEWRNRIAAWTAFRRSWGVGSAVFPD
jgi:hypothetical protein